jgi:hypothetical protein
MKVSTAYFLLMAFVLVMGCRKKDDNGGVITGNANLDAQVMHHTNFVPGVRVYIRNNCASFPADGRDTTLYETALTTDASGYVHFDKLANGTHCLYATGFDPSVGAMVWGYNFIVINNRPGEIKNYELTVPVSE